MADGPCQQLPGPCHHRSGRGGGLEGNIRAGESSSPPHGRTHLSKPLCCRLLEACTGSLEVGTSKHTHAGIKEGPKVAFLGGSAPLAVAAYRFLGRSVGAREGIWRGSCPAGLEKMSLAPASYLPPPSLTQTPGAPGPVVPCQPVAPLLPRLSFVPPSFVSSHCCHWV